MPVQMSTTTVPRFTTTGPATDVPERPADARFRDHEVEVPAGHVDTTAAELRARVCAAFDCPEEDLLGLPNPLDTHPVIPEEVA